MNLLAPIRGLFSSIKIIIFLSILLVIAAGGLWWYRIQTISVQSGRLNIIRITDDNRLKVVQEDIDVLIDVVFPNNGYHTSIMPFSVQAGFEWDKIKQTEYFENGKNRIVLNLPPPIILNVDTADEASKFILKDRDSGEYFDLVKAHKIFGEKYARAMALKRGILNRANEKAKNILVTWIKNMREDTIVEINTQPVKDDSAQEQSINCKTLPIKFQLPKEFSIPAECINNGTMADGFYTSTFKGLFDNKTYIRLKCVGKANDLQSYFSKWGKKYGVLFNSETPEQKIYSTFIDGDTLGYYFIFHGYIYEFSIFGKDRVDLYNTMPRLLLYVLQVRPEDNFKPIENCFDDYGLSRSMWGKATTEERREYFIELIDFYKRDNPMMPMGRVPFPDLEKVIIPIPILVDKDGWDLHKLGSDKFFNSVRDGLKEMLEVLKTRNEYTSQEEFLKDCVGIIFNYNSIHRDRFIFLLSGRAYFYTPKRLFQDSICVNTNYKNLNLQQGDLSVQEEEICFGKEENRCIKSESLSQFLVWLTKYDNRTFVKLFDCESAVSTTSSNSGTSTTTETNTTTTAAQNAGEQAGEAASTTSTISVTSTPAETNTTTQNTGEQTGEVTLKKCYSQAASLSDLERKICHGVTTGEIIRGSLAGYAATSPDNLFPKQIDYWEELAFICNKNGGKVSDVEDVQGVHFVKYKAVPDKNGNAYILVLSIVGPDDVNNNFIIIKHEGVTVMNKSEFNKEPI